VTLFVSERKIHKETSNPTQVVKNSVKILGKSKTKLWIAWTMLRRVGSSIVSAPYMYQMIDLGFKREWFVNIGLIATPVGYALTYFCRRFIKKGKLNHYIWKLTVLSIPTIIFDYAIYADFCMFQNANRTYYLSLLSSMTSVIADLRFILDMGFMNLICDVKIGSTHQTLLACLSNMSASLPASFGLFLCDYINYNFMW